MGVESDRLVFDYLSRVGDLAQTALPAAQRMQLVAQLRNDIDRERRGADSPATVERILGRIGSPDAVVEAAAGTGGRTRASSPDDAPAAEPPPGSYGPYAKRAPGPQVPRARAEDAENASDAKGAKTARSSGRDSDWLRVDPRGAGGHFRAGDELTGLPGMTGGIFIPFDDEDLEEGEDDAGPGPGLAPPAADEEEVYEEEPKGGTPRRRLLRRRAGGGGGKGLGNPVLLLAAVLLIAGAAIGSWIPLGLGWLAGWFSPRLSRPQAKFAVLGIPGLAVLGMAVWLWGRDAGKWSTPIAQGQMGQAMHDAFPATVRLAAFGSALYLLWRSRRTA